MALNNQNKWPLIISTASGNGDGQYVVGDPSPGVVGTIVIQVYTTTPGTIAVTPKVRIRGIVGETPAFAPIAFLSLVSAGAAVAGGTYATAALAGGTIGDIIAIPSSGLDIMLDVDFTDGVHVIEVRKLLGASA